ncbi:hypothetical protein JHN63_51600 [Streptomyces sp. MBT65]|uniref:hypothetical protein n=1 Tax=Streptomyces sp. MBT65 TaxID=1488395 RepID=UPI00190AB583|nr:hypothetical protein [Streptomyces sp. MBT65]MBK3582042.1 hypothetical protein [Streptomyces sp. MBT65]
MSAEVVHRLGVVLGAVLVVGCSVRWVDEMRRERRARRRLAGLLLREVRDVRGSREVPSAGRWFGVRGVARRWVPAVGVVGAGWVLVGGVAGVVVGAVVAVGLWQWRRRQVAGDTVAERDAAIAARQREPADAWRRLAALPGAGPLARLLERADESGLPAAGPVARLAAEARADWARTTTARARRAAVLVTAPVGLCFLPAFIAVGVLPVVIGLAGGAGGVGGGGG